MQTEQPNYYSILGIAPDASIEAIQEAFAELRTEFKQKMADPSKSQRYQQIAYAYEVLSDPDRRALYDSLLQETRPPALRVDVQVSRDKIGISDAAQLVYVLVDVYPPQQRDDTNRPLNLCLVLDRSTSMQGNRLKQVKTAVDLILDKLGPEDVISVIAFSDRAEVLLPASEVKDKRPLMAKILQMTASGGTEIYQGLAAGVNEMKKVPLVRHTNHLILLTDGHTYGDADLCLELAEKAASQDIGFTAFGLGLEWNDYFLDQLVSPSGGQSGFIDEPEHIIQFMQERIQGLGTIYAHNVKLVLNFPQSVKLNYGFKLAPYAQPLPLHVEDVQLGDIEGRRPLSFLLELRIPAQSMETRLKIPIDLIADIPSQNLHQQTFSQHIQFLVLSQTPEVQPPENLLKAVRMLNMYRLNDKVWDDLEAGHVEVAERRMRHLTTRFLEAGQEHLAQQASVEAERLAQMGDLSVEGRKTLKYGTRTLLSQTVRWEQDEQV